MHFIAAFLCEFQEVLKRVMQFCKIIIITTTTKRTKTITFHHIEYFLTFLLKYFLHKNSFSIKNFDENIKFTHLENLKLLIFLERGQGQKNIFAWKWRNIKWKVNKILESKKSRHPSLTKNRRIFYNNFI